MFRTIYCRLVSPSLLKNVSNVQTLSVNHLSTEWQKIEKSLNEVTLLGRCGNDPVVRGSDSRPMAVFSLATHNHWKSPESDEFNQRTQWHRISVFKPRLVEKTVTYIKKGTRVLIKGTINYGDVTDPTTGASHKATSIVADDIIFFASKRVSNETQMDSDSDEEITA